MGSPAPAVVTDSARPELGQFLRATCDYSEGDLVLSELPLLRVPRLRRLTAEAVQKAPKLRQAELFVPPESTSPALQRLRATTREAEPEALFVKSVLHFNSFGAGPAGQDQVVFPTLARANHSCLPNCLVDADLGTLRAVRAVSVGEELTVSYLDDAGLLMDTASRQAELAERYEFRCECCRCSSAQDDTRRFSGCLEGDPSDLVFGSDLWGQAPSTVQQRLLEEEAKAKASLLAARSGDLEEEDEGHELMKCHRFTSAHRHHGLAFALANEFAFPDPEDAKKIVLEVIDLVLAMPCQLSVEASRDLALSLEGRRPDEAKRRWAQAAAVAKVLDGRASLEEVLQEWGRSTAPAPPVIKAGPNTDIEAFGQAQEDGTWLQRQRKAAGTGTLQRRPKTGELRDGSEESKEEASQQSYTLGGPRQDVWNWRSSLGLLLLALPALVLALAGAKRLRR